MTTKRKDNKGRVLREGEGQRKNGSYQYRWRDKAGRRHITYAKTLEKLREKQKRIFKNEVDGLQVTSSKMTLNDMYNIWEKIKRGIKDNTLQNYKYMYEKYVMEELGDYPLFDLKKSDVRLFYINLVEKKDLEIRTLDTIHTVLYQTLEIAVEEDRLRKNPSSNALTELKRNFKPIEKEKQALTIDEQKLFEEVVEKHKVAYRWYPAFMIMLNTGLRVGELTGLTWDDVDFENNTISVNKTLVYYAHEDGKSRLRINTPKTKSSKRVVPMIEAVKEAFEKEKQLQKELKIKQNHSIDGITNFIFVNQHGNPVLQSILNKALRSAIKDYNKTQENNLNPNLLPKITCHTFRHTFTTRQIEAGTNLKVLQDVLGHTDIRTTMNIYAEATDDLKQQEFEKYQSYIDQVM